MRPTTTSARRCRRTQIDVSRIRQSGTRGNAGANGAANQRCCAGLLKLPCRYTQPRQIHDDRPSCDGPCFDRAVQRHELLHRYASRATVSQGLMIHSAGGYKKGKYPDPSTQLHSPNFNSSNQQALPYHDAHIHSSLLFPLPSRHQLSCGPDESDLVRRLGKVGHTTA